MDRKWLPNGLSENRQQMIIQYLIYPEKVLRYMPDGQVKYYLQRQKVGICSKRQSRWGEAPMEWWMETGTWTENVGGMEGKDVWEDTSTPVGSFEPNGYDLYDMAGNAS